MCYVHIMECYSTMKRKEIVMHTVILMNFKNQYADWKKTGAKKYIRVYLLKILENINWSIGIESRPVVVWSQGEGWIEKKHEEILGGDGNVLYLGCDICFVGMWVTDCTGVYIC